jgi:hypothetical protein
MLFYHVALEQHLERTEVDVAKLMFARVDAKEVLVLQRVRSVIRSMRQCGDIVGCDSRNDIV